MLTKVDDDNMKSEGLRGFEPLLLNSVCAVY